MNQWLTESEKLIKNEEKIGSDIDVLQEQIKDNQVGLKSLYHAIEKTANQNTEKPLHTRRYSTQPFRRVLHTCTHIGCVGHCIFDGMLQVTR